MSFGRNVVIFGEGGIMGKRWNEREKRKPGMREYVVGMVKYSKDFYVCCVVYIHWMPAVHLARYLIPSLPAYNTIFLYLFLLLSVTLITSGLCAHLCSIRPTAYSITVNWVKA